MCKWTAPLENGNGSFRSAHQAGQEHTELGHKGDDQQRAQQGDVQRNHGLGQAGKAHFGDAVDHEQHTAHGRGAAAEG